jgi:hypothetical protein
MKWLLVTGEIVIFDLDAVEPFEDISIVNELTAVLTKKLPATVLNDIIPYSCIENIYNELRVVAMTEYNSRTTSESPSLYDKYGVYGYLDFTAISQLKIKLDILTNKSKSSLDKSSQLIHCLPSIVSLYPYDV